MTRMPFLRTYLASTDFKVAALIVLVVVLAIAMVVGGLVTSFVH
jgi:hypothetical protein